MKEIGSEFWTTEVDNDYDNNLDFLNIGSDYRLLMSGATAIDFVLHELDDQKKIVYMPDYCCVSMIKPFKDNNYKIDFYHYDVINNKYHIDMNHDCSIFFAMSYFGYKDSNIDDTIRKFNKKRITIIEDITHRLLSKKSYCKYSNYLVASLRKWFPIISGGIAINTNGSFINDIEKYCIDNEFIRKKEMAMDLKRDYINGLKIDKNEFLSLFNESNELIEEYSNKKIDSKSLNFLRKIDINMIKKKRIENCKIIEKLLDSNKSIRLIYRYKNGDCPLFVPVIINDRNNIRKELINNYIYLPVHWPNELKIDNEIYDKELSLVCDQRYNKKEIEEYINLLIKIIGSD